MLDICVMMYSIRKNHNQDTFEKFDNKKYCRFFAPFDKPKAGPLHLKKVLAIKVALSNIKPFVEFAPGLTPWFMESTA